MIDGVITQHGGDPQRIFTSRLLPAAPSLADAPGVFAEAGIIAGLPFGTAGSASDAMRAKRDPKPAGSPARGDEMRAAAPAPAWRLPGSIWHSAADRTVAAANAEAMEVDVHGLNSRRMVI